MAEIYYIRRKTMKKLSLVLAAAMLIAMFAFTGCGKSDGDSDLNAFYESVDADYSYDVMQKLISFQTNEDLGFRTAGSAAEKEAAEYIEDEMKAIGLENVNKEPVTVDSFTFKNADLRYENNGNENKIEMAMFQSTYKAKNEEVEIVYAGKGTAEDYEDLDVNGKIVLIDINQADEWWINWPSYQAKVKGAKAVIAVNVDGYCTYSEDTLGVQDYCGPSDAPAFTITVADAKPLKKAIKDNGGSIKAVLNADGEVKHDQTSYNVYGEIPGKTNEVIYIFAHYDAYFRAFADNTSGVGCMLGIAKALVESGYEPAKTIKFIGHGAEEWGVDNSRYDWARGAVVEMRNHPDWIDNAYMAINIDSGVTDGEAEGVEITIPYELAEWVKPIGEKIEGSPFKGEFKTNSPAWTWTEAFSYVNAGIPVVDSGLYGSDRSGTYHSNNDTEEGNSFSKEVFEYAHKLYGGMTILFDKQTSRTFDYSALFDEMKASVNSDVIDNADELIKAFDNANEAAALFKEKSESVDGDNAEEFNKEANYLFKEITNKLFTINWDEEFQFVHCYKQTNVEVLEEAINALKKGDVATALDEYLYKIDLNWYAYNFDKQTYDFYVDQVLGDDAENSWGTGYLKSNADLWQVIQDLKAVYDVEKPNVDAQIKALEKELDVQKKDLAKVVKKEISTLEDVTATMKQLSK